MRPPASGVTPVPNQIIFRSPPQIGTPESGGSEFRFCPEMIMEPPPIPKALVPKVP